MPPPLFAEWDWAHGVLTVVIPVLAGAFAWLGRQYERRHAEQRAERDARLTDARQQCADLREENRLLKSQAAGLWAVIARLYEMFGSCRQVAADLQWQARIFREGWERANRWLREKGGTPEEVPPAPEVKLCSPQEADLLKRQAEQGRLVVEAVVQQGAVGAVPKIPGPAGPDRGERPDAGLRP